MNEITQILNAVSRGEEGAVERLWQLVYHKVRRLAVKMHAHEKPGQTLNATALVNKAYLRLFDVEQPQEWHGRTYFFRAAAEAMRRILVEQARWKKRQKRGGDMKRNDLLDPPNRFSHDRFIDLNDRLIDLNDALTKLEQEDPLAAEVVKQRLFVGFDRHEEVASALDITVYRARQKWYYARAWLLAALDPG